MTGARQLQLFVDCPYDGCEHGYCACLETDIDEDLLAELEADPEFEGLDEETRQQLDDLAAGRATMRRGLFRRIHTLPDIAAYAPEGAHP